MKLFYRFNIANLIYTIAVIGWGAFVRATGSGAGCGEHWPLCNGEIIPRPERIQTVIEFMHRITSGVSLILVVIAFFWSRKVAPKGSLIRRAGTITLFAIILEALLGAGLVLLKLVEFDQSVARAVSISLHSVNTLFLLASLATLAWLTSRAAKGIPTVTEARGLFPCDRFFGFTLGVFIALVITGALTALGDTLFPSATLHEGMTADFQSGAHFLLQLRILHPILAFFWILIAFLWSKRLENFHPLPARTWLLLGVTIQFLLGMMNWILMAPIWLQIVHLCVADGVFLALWISGLDYESRKGLKQT